MSNANANESSSSPGEPEESRESNDDLDARWDEIVAELSDLADVEPESSTTGPFDAVIDATAVTQIGSGPRDWPTSAEVEALEEAETHFQAPTEIDLGEPVVPVRIAWFVIVLVIIGAAVSFGFGRALSTWEILGGSVAIAGAVTILIRSLPDHRDDDPTLGAQV